MFLQFFFQNLTNFLRIYEFPLPNGVFRELLKVICSRDEDFYRACNIFLLCLGGDVMHYNFQVRFLDNTFQIQISLAYIIIRSIQISVPADFICRDGFRIC